MSTDVDANARVRNVLREIAKDRDYYAGIPMPLQGEKLVVEPTYPFASALATLTDADPMPEEDGPNLKLRNKWWSFEKHGDILVIEEEGRISWGLQSGQHHLKHDLRTLGCSAAWGIEQESNALDTLSGLLTYHQMKQYLLTGMFLEQSHRSGVMYLFRRLKPTVAIAGERILAVLCLHPIAFYEGSWAGAMCPSDDVLAHLMLMRGDEHLFWKRSNQHQPWRPEAGL
jgi:hypothetical protein